MISAWVAFSFPRNKRWSSGKPANTWSRAGILANAAARAGCGRVQGLRYRWTPMMTAYRFAQSVRSITGPSGSSSAVSEIDSSGVAGGSASGNGEGDTSIGASCGCSLLQAGRASDMPIRSKQRAPVIQP